MKWELPAGCDSTCIIWFSPLIEEGRSIPMLEFSCDFNTVIGTQNADDVVSVYRFIRCFTHDRWAIEYALPIVPIFPSDQTSPLLPLYPLPRKITL